MTERQIDEMIREATDAGIRRDRDAAKAVARKQLLTRAEADGGRLKRGSRLGWRGVAAIAAVLIVPTGAAVAAQLGNDSSEVTDATGRPFAASAAEDCPELAAAAEQRGLDTENLTLAECPIGGVEQGRVLEMLARFADRRTELDDRDAAVEERGADAIEEFGHSEDGKTWSLRGVAGSQAP